MRTYALGGGVTSVRWFAAGRECAHFITIDKPPGGTRGTYIRWRSDGPERQPRAGSCAWEIQITPRWIWARHGRGVDGERRAIVEEGEERKK